MWIICIGMQQMRDSAVKWDTCPHHHSSNINGLYAIFLSVESKMNDSQALDLLRRILLLLLLSSICYAFLLLCYNWIKLNEYFFVRFIICLVHIWITTIKLSCKFFSAAIKHFLLSFLSILLLINFWGFFYFKFEFYFL